MRNSSNASEQGATSTFAPKNRVLGFCEQGPTCVVYPEGTWYSLKDEATMEAVYQHLVEGTIDEQATLKLE